MSDKLATPYSITVKVISYTYLTQTRTIYSVAIKWV